jgi:hypothetical protein
VDIDEPGACEETARARRARLSRPRACTYPQGPLTARTGAPEAASCSTAGFGPAGFAPAGRPRPTTAM